MSKNLEIAKLYFTALRDEILLRVRLSHQIDIAKLVVLSAMLGIGDAPGEATISLRPILYLVPPVAVLFDMYLVYNFRMVHSIGRFIKEEVEDNWFSGQLDWTPQPWTFWESWIFQSRQRRWDALGRLVQFLFTAGASAMAIYLLRLPVASWYVAVVGVMLALDVVLIGFLQKLFRSYYS